MVFNTFSDGAFGTGAVAALETDVATWNQKRRCWGPDLDCKKLVGGSLKTSYLSNLHYMLIVLYHSNCLNLIAAWTQHLYV